MVSKIENTKSECSLFPIHSSISSIKTVHAMVILYNCEKYKRNNNINEYFKHPSHPTNWKTGEVSFWKMIKMMEVFDVCTTTAAFTYMLVCYFNFEYCFTFFLFFSEWINLFWKYQEISELMFNVYIYGLCCRFRVKW